MRRRFKCAASQRHIHWPHQGLQSTCASARVGSSGAAAPALRARARVAPEGNHRGDGHKARQTAADVCASTTHKNHVPRELVHPLAQSQRLGTSHEGPLYTRRGLPKAPPCWRRGCSNPSTCNAGQVCSVYRAAVKSWRKKGGKGEQAEGCEGR